MTFAVRTAGEPAAIVGAVRAAIQQVDPDQPIANVHTMDELMDQAVGQRRLSMTLLATFAALAMVLAALGIYGVMAFDVTRRIQEIGVRMALGADRGRVLAMVLRQGLTLAVAGVVIGLAGAFALTRVLQAQLFGVARTDPATFASVADRPARRRCARNARAGPARDARRTRSRRCGTNEPSKSTPNFQPPTPKAWISERFHPTRLGIGSWGLGFGSWELAGFLTVSVNP